jgi:DNA repair photolyase
MKPIYEPKGRAGEYCGLAINIYTGCNHGCTYCYARKMHDRYKPNENFADVKPRDDIVEATRVQLSSGKYEGKTIQLCFTCDPYPAEIDTTPTREIIKAIKEAGAHVQILTKGGFRAACDFDLLDSEDSFGVTISDYTGLYELYAPLPKERLNTIKSAHKLKIKTWVSCEPVFDFQAIYDLINSDCPIDLFKIGKLNYYPSDINWGKFGRECERLCKLYGRNYYIKADLRKEMET